MEWSVSCIVPAHNEAPRIGSVLSVLAACPEFCEVIVVDDGSTDETGKAAAAFGVKVLRESVNCGKGAALARGVREATGSVFFFCDADLKGLTVDMVRDIVKPVANAELDMFIGCRERARLGVLRTAFVALPALEGQRALTRELWDSVPQEFKREFEIETALNFFAARSPRGLGIRIFPNLSQVTKEEKYGRVSGAWRRLKMYQQIVAANLRLHAQYA